MVDPVPPSEPGLHPIGALLVAASVVGAFRASRMGATVTSTQVIVRNVFSTRRINLVEIEQVTVRNYDGVLVWDGGRTSWFCTVVLTTEAGKVVKAYGLLGWAAAVSRRARRLRELIGLPERQETAKHRSS